MVDHDTLLGHALAQARARAVQADDVNQEQRRRTLLQPPHDRIPLPRPGSRCLYGEVDVGLLAVVAARARSEKPNRFDGWPSLLRCRLQRVDEASRQVRRSRHHQDLVRAAHGGIVAVSATRNKPYNPTLPHCPDKMNAAQ